MGPIRPLGATRSPALDRVAARLLAEAGFDPPPWLLRARVEERARALGLPEEAWAALAGADDPRGRAERAQLIESLRVGRTRFFRHQAQLQLIEERALGERARLATATGRSLAVWSAGCASGEEAWTLALLAQRVAPSRWEVVATDLSEAALATARAGRYPAARRDELPEWAARLIGPPSNGELVVPDWLRPAVTFARHNLLDRAVPTSSSGGFDVILCCNVLIYFDDAARAQVVERLVRALHPGGYLFVGYSESLRDHLTALESERVAEGVLYRRPSGPPATPASRPRLGDGRDARPEPVVAPAAATSPAPQRGRLRLSGDLSDASAVDLPAMLRPLLVPEVQSPTVELDGVTELGDEAARVLRRARQARPDLRLVATRPSVKRWLERHRLELEPTELAPEDG